VANISVPTYGNDINHLKCIFLQSFTWLNIRIFWIIST